MGSILFFGSRKSSASVGTPTPQPTPTQQESKATEAPKSPANSSVGSGLGLGPATVLNAANVGASLLKFDPASFTGEGISFNGMDTFTFSEKGSFQVVINFTYYSKAAGIFDGSVRYRRNGESL